MGDLNNPDFQTVIIRRKQTSAEAKRSGNVTTVAKTPTNKATSGLDLRKIDNESIKLPTASHDLKISLQQARSAKGMTQEQLNNQLSLPPGTIRDYENGKAVLNPTILSKINKTLGSQLKMKVQKNEKLDDDKK